MSAGVECFIWSTLPSSQQISGGKYVSRIYEGTYPNSACPMSKQQQQLLVPPPPPKALPPLDLILTGRHAHTPKGKYHVDDYIREKNYPAVFLYTGNFYENMILRSHMRYDAATDTVEFRQPVVDVDTKLAMLFVERDLSAVAKAVLDRWWGVEGEGVGEEKDAPHAWRRRLTHRYLYCADARVSPRDILACVERVSGKRAVYRRLETTGWADRDVMFRLYNECGMYGTKALPDENVLALGVELHGVEDFVRSRLLPHLGLSAVDQ